MHIDNKHMRAAGVLLGVIGIASMAGCNSGSSTPFAVQSTSPAAGAELVPIDSQIAVTFTRAVNSTTFSASDVQLECEGKAISFADTSFEDNDKTVVLAPDSSLPENADCKVLVAAEAQDLANSNLQEPFEWGFGTTASPETLALGKEIFRHDTFGDERFWTDELRMHEVIQSAVDPVTALSVGLKVDAEALPEAVVDGIAQGTIDLESPETTVALLKLDAVVGVKGSVEEVNGVDTLTSVGVTCALCHSTVDNSFALE